MKRLGRILTLGLEKKRAWQLPIIAGLLALFGLGVRWWYNSRAARTLSLVKLVEIGDIDGVRYVCKWDRGQVNKEGEIPQVRVFNGEVEKELYTQKLFPLCLAAHKGHTEVAKILLTAGAEVNAKNEYDFTPLDWAATGGHSEVAKLLIKAGAEVSTRTEGGCTTPLHWAARKGHLEMCKTLIDAGFDVNDIDGLPDRTALHWALCGKRRRIALDLCELLINSGADVNASDDAGSTPLHCAARFKLDESASEIDGDAAAVGLAICRLLIAAGANVAVSNADGYSPLYMAVIEERPAICKLLIDSGAVVNPRVQEERAPFHMAAHLGNLEICRTLLDAGAELNLRKNGITPLHNVIHPWTIKLLIEAGANVNARVKSGWWAHPTGNTPLHSILQTHTRINWSGTKADKMAGVFNDMVGPLVNAGADLNAQNKAGDTPLDIIVKKLSAYDDNSRQQKSKVIDVLRKHGAKTGAELDAEAKQGKAEKK